MSLSFSKLCFLSFPQAYSLERKEYGIWLQIVTKDCGKSCIPHRRQPYRVFFTGVKTDKDVATFRGTSRWELPRAGRPGLDPGQPRHLHLVHRHKQRHLCWNLDIHWMHTIATDTIHNLNERKTPLTHPSVKTAPSQSWSYTWIEPQ